jgi:hypothetical protein
MKVVFHWSDRDPDIIDVPEPLLPVYKRAVWPPVAPGMEDDMDEPIEVRSFVPHDLWLKGRRVAFMYVEVPPSPSEQHSPSPEPATGPEGD